MKYNTGKLENPVNESLEDKIDRLQQKRRQQEAETDHRLLEGLQNISDKHNNDRYSSRMWANRKGASHWGESKRSSINEITIESSDSSGDIQSLVKLLYLLQDLNKPICLQIYQTLESHRTSIIPAPQELAVVEKQVRGSAPNWSVTTQAIEPVALAEHTVAATLQPHPQGDWATTLSLERVGTSPLIALIHAGLPSSPTGLFCLRLLIRPVSPERRAQAHQDLFVPMDDPPLSYRLLMAHDWIFDCIGHMIFGKPQVPRFNDRKLQDELLQRVASEPAWSVIGSLIISDSSHQLVEQSAKAVSSVLKALFDVGFGGLSLSQFCTIKKMPDYSFDKFDEDKAAFFSMGELVALYHPVSADSGLPGIRAIGRPNPSLPNSLFESKGIVIGTVEQRGNNRFVPLPSQTFDYGVIPITGPSGYGKSELAENMLYQALESNDHTAFSLDPHGLMANNIALRSIPAGRENDVYIIELGDTEYPPAITFSRDTDTSPEAYISSTESLLKAALRDTWSSSFARMDDTISALVTMLAYYPNSNLYDIERVMTEDQYRAKAVSYITDPIAMRWWQRFEAASKSDKEHMAAPILSRLGKLWRNTPVRNMIMQEPLENPFSGLGDRSIVMVTVVGEPIAEEAEFLMELLLAKFRSAMAPRFPNRYKRTFCVIDESQRIAGNNLPSIIREYRKVGVSTWTITQGMSGWSDQVSKVVVDNYSAVISFAPRDERRLEAVFTPYTQDDFAKMNRHEALVRMSLADHTTLPSFVMKTIKIDRPQDPARLERIRHRSRERFTRPKAVVERYIEELLSQGLPETENEPKPSQQRRKVSDDDF
jgi:hypothetical protein